MNTSDLIQPHHRERRAVIYVRQSSPNQVTNNQESLRLQYALRQRAVELGWHERDIVVIDADLGHTAATTEGRVGFQSLVAQIALAEIGILIAYDATRLARNCSHWYQLLDLCGRTACLISDRDGIYDPSSINGRLLLGLKGQISELELHTIRTRLNAGILNKAQRGDLPQALPTGLMRLETGQVVKHPDQEIQDRITLVFETLLEKKSLSRVSRHFRQNELRIPRQDWWGRIHWRPATVPRLSELVTNPAYAGAFVYGRTAWQVPAKGGPKQQRTVPREDWRFVVHDKYPAYISWETFERIQAMLHDNYADFQHHANRGVPREGEALLQGIAYCGECGYRLFVSYGQRAHYLCQRPKPGGGSLCQHLPAQLLDEQVVRCFFEALSTAEIDVSAQVLAEADRSRDQVLAARRQEVERFRYQARLADRQFHAADPDNRLVTAELERRWDEALRACQDAEARLRAEESSAPCFAIPLELLEQLKDVGRHLPELWQQNLWPQSRRKALLRTLVDKVVLHRIARSNSVRLRVVWRGGASTTKEIRVPVRGFAQLADAQELTATLLRLAREGQADEQIAETLASQGHCGPHGDPLRPSSVRRIRLAQGILQNPNKSRRRGKPGYLTISELAKKLDVPPHRIYDQIRAGKIRLSKDASTGCYLFPDHPDTLTMMGQLADPQTTHIEFKMEHPDGISNSHP